MEIDTIRFIENLVTSCTGHLSYRLSQLTIIVVLFLAFKFILEFVISKQMEKRSKKIRLLPPTTNTSLPYQ